VIADAVLVLHFLIVLFIVGGLVLTWAGFFLQWEWVQNPLFRYLHVAAIVFVALEALAGYACPLTVWEDALRGGARPESFIGRWVQRVLFYQAPEWVFTVLYSLWAAATVATLKLVPPRRRAG
jgi:hypothetical protein